MTQEEKQILLKDLCERLPYGVMVKVEGEKYFNETKEPYTTNLSLNNYILDYNDVTITPYLRPMSSMTEEEIDRMWEIYESGPAAESSVAVADYLYERHLDCHYLIEKGLALEAPADMYKND